MISFSNRCFPTKAVSIWLSPGVDRAELVALYLARAGFSLVEAGQMLMRDRGGDPLWAVTGRAPAAAP